MKQLRSRGKSSKEDKFIEVDNCIVPETLAGTHPIIGKTGFRHFFTVWPDARGCCFLSSGAAGSEESLRLLK